MKIVLITVLLALVCQAYTFSKTSFDEWYLFKLQYKKQYASEREERFRMKIFMENKRKVAKHNFLFAQGIVSYSMGLNQFSDMLPEEVVARYTGLNRFLSPIERNGSTFTLPANFTAPAEIDWRKKGAVTPVKDQKHCGSCWAFSATGALEGQHYRKTKKLVSLSEQNLIDCSKSYGNMGCDGGWMDIAFQYIKENKGIDSEKAYPYEGKDKICRFNNAYVAAHVSAISYMPPYDERTLQGAIATVGPISATIAVAKSFRAYKSGIYYEPKCTNELSHGVLIVGYGSSGVGKDYWIVKNSWGPTWGDKGYIKMARNRKNNCGIATSTMFPIV